MVVITITILIRTYTERRKYDLGIPNIKPSC